MDELSPIRGIDSARGVSPRFFAVSVSLRLSRALLATLLLAAALLIQSCAIEVNHAPADPQPQWMTSRQYRQLFDRKLNDGFYPYEVFGRCDAGYEQFSARWTGLPLGWKFYAHHGAFKENFDSYDQEYRSKGYTLEFSSAFEDCAGKIRYQGVWLKKP